MTGGGEYGVRLEDVNFEGPLDLLLFLIKKNEIEITDIPIALVTEQFLTYLERITAEKLEAAGEFLLMAATLLRIKARMLLPAPEGLEDEELEDPRTELVAQILEYQQVREVAGHLRTQEQRALELYPRGAREPLEPAPAAEEPPERRVTLKDLLRAFADVLAAHAAQAVHHVDEPRVTLEERVLDVRRAIAASGRVRFSELFPAGASRIELVMTLIALLEMVRAGEVRLRQDAAFGEILVLAGEPAEEPWTRS